MSTSPKKSVCISGYIGEAKQGVKSTSFANFSSALALANAEAAEGEGVDIYMHTPGGSNITGNAMITAIKSNPKPVTTHNDGFIASMGVPVFAAGTNRLTAKHALFMLHGASVEALDNTKASHDEASNILNATNTSMATILAEVMKDENGDPMTVEAIIEKYFADGRDHYLTAEEAVNCGLATGFANYDAENMPTDITAMSNKEIAAHFGYEDSAIENDPESVLDESTAMKLNWIVGDLRNLFSDATCLEDDDPVINDLRTRIITAAASFIKETVNVLYSPENLPVEMIESIIDKSKMEPRAVVKADETIKAELKSTAEKLESVTGKYQEVVNISETLQKQLTEATARITELEKLPAAGAGIKNPLDDNFKTSEPTGWEKYDTSTDRELKNRQTNNA